MDSLHFETREVLRRPAAVDFIENRLSQHHQVFRNPPPHFDLRTQCYIAAPTQNRMPNNASPGPAAPTNLDAMPFWNTIFIEAMARFQTRCAEPKEIRASRFRIRDKTSWSEIETQLQSARESYVQATGIRGWIRQSRRAVADNSQVAVQAWKWVPNVEVTSPIINVVQSLLEVRSIRSRILLIAHPVAGRAQCSKGTTGYFGWIRQT
jgi:hypothetical protein